MWINKKTWIHLEKNNPKFNNELGEVGDCYAMKKNNQNFLKKHTGPLFFKKEEAQ